MELKDSSQDTSSSKIKQDITTTHDIHSHSLVSPQNPREPHSTSKAPLNNDIFIHQPQSISITDPSASYPDAITLELSPLDLVVPDGKESDCAKNSVRRAIGHLLSRTSSSASIASSVDNKGQHLINKVSEYLSPFQTRNNSSVSLLQQDNETMLSKKVTLDDPPTRRHTTVVPSIGSKLSVPNDEKDILRSYTPEKVKETRHVYVDYDPVSRRKVLNTYEILKDLGRGQHGKVKLARDMLSNRLVAIKIVDRKTKPKLGKLTKPGSSQEDKIRKEVAILKKCDHPHVVKLIEVLDDVTSRKIYLVLEYLEKGEIKWQSVDEVTHEAKPVLKFHEAQKVFRDVILGLEYLHYQGIIHRDIKPANLLVSADNEVKISDFGVSFASSLDDANNEYELCKTAGTPAFLAPELCRTDVLSQEHEMKVDHKIDIWALGVTLFCLLFGRLPFNSDSEFKLFEVINNQELKVPEKSTLVDSDNVTEYEWDATVDLLKKLLAKDPSQRIDIPEIKHHAFFLHGLSKVDSQRYTTGNESIKLHVSNEEVDYAVVGIGSKIKKKLVKAFKRGFSLPEDYTSSNSHSLENIDSLHTSGSSSSKQSTTKLNTSSTRSLILSEALSPEFPSTGDSTPQRHHSIKIAGLQNKFGDRRGSADLIETKDNLEGSFKKSNNGALEHIKRFNSPQSPEVNTHVAQNSYLKESKSRQSSVDHSKGFALSEDPASRRLRLNSSFASLDSLHEDTLLDVSAYVPVGVDRGKNNGVAFNNVKYGGAKPEAVVDDDLDPKVYEPVSSGDNLSRTASKYSRSSVSSSSSCVSTRGSHSMDNLSSTTPVKTVPLRTKFFSLHDSSDDDDDDEDNRGKSNDDTTDEEGESKELTFAFGRNSDAPFLRNRVMSHESNIRHAMRPASSNNLSFGYDHSEYVLPTLSSTVDIPEEFQNLLPEFQSLPVSSTVTNKSSPVRTPLDLSSSIDTVKNSRVSSPLALNAPSSPKATVSSHLFSDPKRSFDVYKNHYSKEHNVSPFEHSHHLAQNNGKRNAEGTNLHRNNSITIGLLQLEHDK